MSKLILKRVVKAGYMSFRRNGWLSTATILVTALALFVMGTLIFVGAIAGTVLASLESKIDVSVYFNPDAPEESITAVRRDLETLPEVAKVAYISREEALEVFRARHKNNALIAGALEELGGNPLEASLNIKARDPSQYAAISNFLLDKNYSVVDKINYFENQIVIDRLAAILSTVRGSGAFIALLLAFIAVLVAFNTVRLAIYTMREEIGIMRLVGATKWFIRGPFIISGILYGAIAASATTAAFFPLTWFLAPKLSLIIPQFDLFQYLLANFLEFFAVILASGIFLGAVSSMIAIRRYLEV